MAACTDKMTSATSLSSSSAERQHRRRPVITAVHVRPLPAVVPLFPAILLLLIASTAVPAAASGGGVCDGGCQNGGKLLMPNNLFGVCRCRCPPDYKGPKCQFIDKRSTPPIDGAPDGIPLGGGSGSSAAMVQLYGLDPSESIDLEDLLRTVDPAVPSSSSSSSLSSSSRRQLHDRLGKLLMSKMSAAYDSAKPSNGLSYGLRQTSKGYRK